MAKPIVFIREIFVHHDFDLADEDYQVIKRKQKTSDESKSLSTKSKVKSALKPNAVKYLQSITEELTSQADRVRDLIGEKHWFSDGHHKEYLLLSLLKRHLPHGMRASRGFIICPNSGDLLSREQDVLIIDSTIEQPIFDQGGLIIAFPHSLRAAISVKSTLGAAELKDSIIGLNSVRRVLERQEQSNKLWCGMMAFKAAFESSSLDAFVTTAATAIKENAVFAPLCTIGGSHVFGPQTICSLDGYLFKAEYRDNREVEILPYHSMQLAAAMFLQDLLSHLASQRGLFSIDLTSFADIAWTTQQDSPKGS